MTGPRYSQAGLQALKAGSRIVPARQQLNLLAAVEALPPAHDCPGLANCTGHPRWNVIRMFSLSYVYSPKAGITAAQVFDTHAAAIAYATSRARAEQLAAITHSEGTDALPADLETS